MTQKPAVGVAEARAFLARHHDRPETDIASVEPLAGGFWSAAFAYELDGRELVVRFGAPFSAPNYEIDRRAAAFARPGLPIPEVLAVATGNDIPGGAVAISTRLHGRFAESVGVDEAGAVGDALTDLLAALHAVPHAGEPVDWYRETDDALASGGWRDWLRRGMDDDGDPENGWKAKLAEDRDGWATFEAAAALVGERLDTVPERRDLLHGDLMHQNVLVSDDASRVTGVFSWKLSVRGDFLFDVALCTFWAPWHPGIGAARIFDRVAADPRFGLVDRAARTDAAERHHTYELQLGASHLGWMAQIGDTENLRKLTAHTRDVIARGPLPATEPD